MIEPELAWMALATVSTLATTTAGWTLGARRARRRAEGAAEESRRPLVAARDASERRARELQAQNALWRATSLAPRALPAQPHYRERMAPLEHAALIEMLQGLTQLDDAVIADPSGLPTTRETENGSAALAALAAPVELLRRALAKVAVGVAEVRLETFDAVHVVARLLGGRADGATLLARSMSLRVNPLAIDAVALVAAGNVEPAVPPLGATLRGASDRRRPPIPDATGFLDDLERELGRSKLRALVFGSHGKASFSAADDGPAEALRGAAFAALDAFQARAAQLLHSARVARVDVALQGGGVLRWSALSRELPWALVIVADDGATSPALVERLSGRLRRGIDAATFASTSTATSGSANATSGSAIAAAASSAVPASASRSVR
jgi:hypothetical protein